MQPLEIGIEVRHRNLAVAILTNDGRRDALPHLRRRIRHLIDTAIGVAVHVDEAGRDDEAGRVDRSFAGFRRQAAAELDNRVACDSDVGSPCLSASPID